MSETIFHSNFAEQDKRFASNFRSVQIAGDGGTEVTLDGEVQGTFAADVYVAARLAELVAQSPETLDTLAELATALGNDPNFATTVMEMLGQKVNDADVPVGGLIERKANGAWGKVGYAYSATGGTLAMRDKGGKLSVGTADGDTYAVPLKQLNTILDERIGDISAALDAIHAHAQALVAGGATA